MNGFDVRKNLLLTCTVLVCIFTFYMTRRIFFSVSGPVVVDYWAFVTGVFLAGEGLWSMMRTKGDYFLVHFSRLLRISIGVCIFTIHLFQFTRDGKLGGQVNPSPSQLHASSLTYLNSSTGNTSPSVSAKRY